MYTKDFYYDLPSELIAQTPLENRLESRLLTLDKQTGQITHGKFRDVFKNINKGDCLVLNNTKVMPARLYGKREGTGARVEMLLVMKKFSDIWEVLVKPGKKAVRGNIITFADGLLKAEILDTVAEGNRLVKFIYEGNFDNILEKIGEMPLPHYITEKLDNKGRYQTVYAGVTGSVAAPTAGLHFTEDFLQEIEESGVNITEVTLHVGLGTFRPVKAEKITEHNMHSEWYEVSQETAEIINKTKRDGGKVIAVGTTAIRTLESASNENGILEAKNAFTNIFIYPGYKFKLVDRLITNFHLPESTLIMLVSAMAGRENVLNAYNEAIKQKYRFFSFGDAMFVV